MTHRHKGAGQRPGGGWALCPLIFVLALASACNRNTPTQGEASGEIIADDERRSVVGSLLGATLSENEGWVAIEVESLRSPTVLGSSDVGPMCIWVRSALLEAAGPMSLAASWPQPSPPYTNDAWYCLPGEAVGDLFVGVRCTTPNSEETPTPGDTEAAVTPVATPTPTHEPTPTQRPPVGSLNAISGGIEVVDTADGVCDLVSLKLVNVVFENQSCDGPVTALEIVELTVEGVLLSPGRDWSTGGFTECPGAY